MYSESRYDILMKILQINAVNGILSTGRTCSEMETYLNSHGHECYTAYSTGTMTPLSKAISPLWECKVHALLSRVTGLQGYFSFVSTRNIISYIREIEPDIVHLRNLHANYVSLKPLLSFLAGEDIPTVITLHDCFFYTGKCTYYSSQNCDKWKTGCYECPLIKEDNTSWFFDRTSKMWSDKKRLFSAIPRLGVVGVSDWLTKEAEKSFLSCAKVIRRIYNFIDLGLFQPVDAVDIKEKLGLSGYQMILGVASKWNRRKGFERFLSIAPLLDKNTMILLVGDIPPISLPQNVISLPLTNDPENLVKLYSAADVFLQLSEEETFGKVTVEALACGCPIVTNDKTANPELVGEGCGEVYHDDNPKAIYDIIRRILSAGKPTYSNVCRAYAEKNFDADCCINEYLELYKELL